LNKTINYISFGKYETGGYKHELFFAEQLCKYLNKENGNVKLNIIRKNRFYSTPFQYLKLFLLGLKANGNYNIVVARVALFAILRNVFTKNKVYIVLHNFDKNDGKSFWLNWYYNFLFWVLKNTTNKNVSIVTVAPFWVNYFKEKINKNIPVHLFPNFFDSAYYEKFWLNNILFEQNLINTEQKQLKGDSTDLNFFTPLQLTEELNAFNFTLQCFYTDLQDFIIILQHLGTVPEHLGTVPEHLGTIPEHLKTVPEHLKIIQEHLGNVPEHSENSDEHIGNSDEHLKYIPKHLETIDKHLTIAKKHYSIIEKHLANTAQNDFKALNNAYETFKDSLNESQNSAKSFQNAKEVLNNLLLFFKKTEKKKKKQIHLGQWSFKNHPDVFEVAKQLTAKGYYCYFSTNFKDFAAKNSNYEVVYFEQFEDYLTQMAASEFTLALTAINEGWNRVAHESILVGTPVIAYAKAGLLDLVNESNSYAAISIADVLKTIENKNVQVNSSLLANYNIKNSEEYLYQILF